MRLDRYNQRRTIQNVLKQWYRQYPGDKDGIGKKLEKLNLNKCAASTVDKIIGNQSWTHMFCSICSTYHSVGVELDTGDHTVQVCGPCLHQAIGLLEVK